jgi:AraC-like DNA-binding protein
MLQMVENMSETVVHEDPLSALLRRLRFGAEVFLRAHYCGRWAVDTSGERHVPFHLVTEGRGWLHLPGAAPELLAAGELVLFPRDGAHVLASTPEAPDPGIVNQGPPARLEGEHTALVCGHFAFDARAAEPLLEGLPEVMRLRLDPTGGRDDDAAPGTDALVGLWMREAASAEPGSALVVDLLAGAVFVHVLRVAVARGELCGVFGALTDPRLGPVLADIHRAPGEAHEVEVMAARSGMSVSAFAKRFRGRIGMTPARYVRHWRMHAAVAAVRGSDRSMADIAEEVGYDSEVAFRKAFSGFFGTPPGALRRAARAT